MTFCRLLTEVLDTTVSTLLNETSNSPAVDTNDGLHNLFAILFGIYLIIQIGFLILISIVAWKKRQRMRECLGRKGWNSSITIQCCLNFGSPLGVSILYHRLQSCLEYFLEQVFFDEYTFYYWSDLHQTCFLASHTNALSPLRQTLRKLLCMNCRK